MKSLFWRGAASLLMLLMSLSVQAENYIATANLSSAAQVPSIVAPDAFGQARITINVQRDATNSVISVQARFQISGQDLFSPTVTKLLLHEGASTANGPIRVDAVLPGPQPIFQGMVQLDRTVMIPLDVWQRWRANPAGFYVNVATASHPNGLLRGQLTQLREMLPLEADINFVGAQLGKGKAQAIVYPTRNFNGQISGGDIEFAIWVPVSMQQGATAKNITITGLQLRPSNGAAVVDGGIVASHPLVFPLNTEPGDAAVGAVAISRTVEGVDGNIIQNLLNNPSSHLITLRTNSALTPNHPTGGEFSGKFNAMTMEAYHSLMKVSGDTQRGEGWGGIDIFVKDPSLNAQIEYEALYLNGIRAGNYASSLLPGIFVGTTEAPNGDVVLFQLGTEDNPVSMGRYISTAPVARRNEAPATTVGAASYQRIVAPQSIVSLFGTKLATKTTLAQSLPLPTTLDGTTVYLNGVPVPLFFVSPTQINYLIPSGTPPGDYELFVVAADGTVSQGTVTVAATTPAIFTMNQQGTGAPAAVAAVDGVTFDLPTGNPDGTPRPLSAGNFVALFGTGFRFARNDDLNAGNGSAESMRLTIGGLEVPMLYAGAQGQYAGLDQINFQIPAALAGRGVVDLVITIDGRASNSVKIHVR